MLPCLNCGEQGAHQQRPRMTGRRSADHSSPTCFRPSAAMLSIRMAQLCGCRVCCRFRDDTLRKAAGSIPRSASGKRPVARFQNRFLPPGRYSPNFGVLLYSFLTYRRLSAPLHQFAPRITRKKMEPATQSGSNVLQMRRRLRREKDTKAP